MLIRAATKGDVGAITALYNQLGVATTTSYDLEPVSLENRLAWFDDHLAHGWPVLVADEDGAVIGYAAYGMFRPKPGYAATVEHSVYVDPDHQGKGVGRALMNHLIEVATRQDVHAIVAVIDAENPGSVAFHERLGFKMAGTLPQVGRKFDRWLDAVYMVLLLDGTQEPGLDRTRPSHVILPQAVSREVRGVATKLPAQLTGSRVPRDDERQQRAITRGADMIDTDNAWLLVIDPQVIFASPTSEWAATRFDEALGVARSLAPRFRDRVLVTRWLPDQHPQGSWAAYFERWPFAARPLDDPIFDLMPGARGLSPYPTFDCPTFSKWGLRLQSLTGPTPTLVLTGVSTDCCVLSTALAAADAGATVLVVADGCAASSEEHHAAGLRLMAEYEPQISVVQSVSLL